MHFAQLTAEQLENAAGMLKAMAHPVRIAILNVLDTNAPLTVTELHEKLGIEQASASHHLGILKDKGILGVKRDGKSAIYFIKNNRLSTMIDCVNSCACAADKLL